MEKMLIKGRKYETDKKESKWFVQDSDEHTEDLAAGMAAEELTVFGEVANLLGAYEELGTPEELRELISMHKGIKK